MKKLFIVLVVIVGTQLYAISPKLLNKRFNEVCFIQSHNATANKDSLVHNQDRALEQQLADGIRSIKIPLCYDYANPLDYYYDLLMWYFFQSKKIDEADFRKFIARDYPQVLYACHGLAKEQLYGDYIDQLFDYAPSLLQPVLNILRDPLKKAIAEVLQITFGNQNDVGGLLPFTPCLIDRGKTALAKVLSEIKDFLEKNPQEIFVLKVEDFTDHPFADIAQEFEQSAILTFAHSQDHNQPWPTLAEMITSNKRLVILITEDVQDAHPWANDYWFFDQWHATWDFKKVSDLTKITFDPQQEFLYPNYRDTQFPYNKFLTIHQVVTPLVAGNKDDAAQVNAYAPFLYRAQQLALIAGHIPNFISIDFYESPDFDVFKVQDTLNGIS